MELILPSESSYAAKLPGADGGLTKVDQFSDGLGKY